MQSNEELLTERANQLKTDKGTTFACSHGYTKTYAALWSFLRDKPIEILEIGLNRTDDRKSAPSLELWRYFFTHSATRIHGFDIDDFQEAQNKERGIFIWRGNQGEHSAFDQFGSMMFDIIVDDGSHQAEHQQTTLYCLWNRLKRGGWYVIEDLHVDPRSQAIAEKWSEGIPVPGVVESGLSKEIMEKIISESEIAFFPSYSKLWKFKDMTRAMLVFRKI